MAGRQGGQREPWYSTKVITPAPARAGGAGASGGGARLPAVEKGEDLSSINVLLQQIRAQAGQGTTQPPNR
jgi:hypothetical protein